MNQLDVEVDDSSIEVSSDVLRVKVLAYYKRYVSGKQLQLVNLQIHLFFKDETSTQGVYLEENLQFLQEVELTLLRC